MILFMELNRSYCQIQSSSVCSSLAIFEINELNSIVLKFSQWINSDYIYFRLAVQTSGQT